MIGRPVDIGLPTLAHPGEFADLDLFVWLKVIMYEQTMLMAPPDVVAGYEF
jgi:hypothetical protein